MSKKQFLRALERVRSGALDEGVAIAISLDPGFVRRRLNHYKGQPDHREAAAQLEAALEASTVAEPVPEPPEPAPIFEAPLSAPIAPPPMGAVGLDEPEPFLSWVSADWDRIGVMNLENLVYAEVWSLVGLRTLLFEERRRRPPVNLEGASGPARFAHALGLDALAGGRSSELGEPARTVRLTRIRTRGEIEPTADRMATLVVPDEGERNVRLAIKYVFVELLRNVVQHSGDPLGAVAAAQRMDAGQRRARPMIQLAVADAGIGIPRHLHRAHPHLTDYRQALERALLPHISGTFEEGLTGSFENAGVGLYMISEITRRTGGRLLVATHGASLVIDAADPQGPPAHPRFLRPVGTGFPGTLVCAEMPVGISEDFHALMQSINRAAQERAPKRVSSRWLSFSSAAAPALRVALADARENTLAAAELAATTIRPALLRNEPVELDFGGLELCTQSWLHALLFEPIRIAWALRIPIHVVNVDPAVREGLRFLEAYALGG